MNEHPSNEATAQEEGHKARKVSYLPTEGLSYDPVEPKYWSKPALQQELTRVFEVCHGCRMCFKYCDAFPRLFDFIDNCHDGEVEKLTPSETGVVVDACFQCKLCEIQCPYTPREGHEFQLDFPKLLHRYGAQQARDQGVPLASRVLGDPDMTGQLARASFGLANSMNRVKAHRWFLEKVLGVHRDKLLPEFAQHTFAAWAKREGLIHGEAGGEAVLFQTCYVEHNEPQIGKDTVAVYRQNQVDLRCAEGLVCCGMPAWESGDLAELRRRAAINLQILKPFVDSGAKVVAINPTCSMMLRMEYPHLVDEPMRELAHEVAASVRDPSEFLWAMRREERFDLPSDAALGKVAYHAPCHLRAQSIGFRGRDLLRKAGAEIDSVVECCGHDGTYAMTVAGFEDSQRQGQKAFAGMQDAAATTWVTDCPLAALQFEQHAGTRPLHPMSLLARTYRDRAQPLAAVAEPAAAKPALAKKDQP